MNVKKLKGFLRMAGPVICGCLASVGAVVTAVLSAKGALKAEKVLRDEELSAMEKAKAAAPAFIPAGVAGIATTSLIFAANVLGAKQQSALVAGFAYARGRMQKYCDEMENAADIPEEPVWFYDEISKRYFKRTYREVLEAEYHLNRNFILRGYAPLNEFYDFLNLDRTNDGDKLGWSAEMGDIFYGYQWIDFDHDAVPMEGDNRGCLVIKMPFAPTDDYMADPCEEVG